MNKKALGASVLIVLGICSFLFLIGFIGDLYGFERMYIPKTIAFILISFPALHITQIIYKKLKKKPEFNPERSIKLFVCEGNILLKFNISTDQVFLSPDQAINVGKALKQQGRKILSKRK